MKTRQLISMGIWCVILSSSTWALAQDTTSPSLVDIFRTPNAIDTTLGDQQVDFTLEITDDLSGFSNGYVQMRSPSGSLFEIGFFNASGATSGNSLNGTYETSLTFNQFTEAGVWEPNFIQLRDDVGNTQNLNATDITALGLNLSVAVNVPEPTSFLLATFAGLLGLGSTRRRGVNENHAETTLRKQTND